MKKRIFCLGLLLAVCFCGMGYAQDGAALMETLLYPHEALSLNMVHPFEPIEMDWGDFNKNDRAFLQTLGLEESDQQDIAASGASTWHSFDDYGRDLVVVFCGSYGEYGFLFLRNSSGITHLTDVLLGCYGAQNAASTVTMQNGVPYLLTEAWGHGSGTDAWWTRWYNLNTRRMELSYLLHGSETGYQIAAQAATVTSLDSMLQRTIEPNDKQYFVTYTYTALVAYSGAQSNNLCTSDAQCTVRVYEATLSGMQLLLERTFANASPAVIQNLSVEMLLSNSLVLAP